MFNASVELFYKDTHILTSIDELSKNKRVLFCSLIRHIEQSTFQYIRDMVRWQKTLDTYDVTLYFLTSQPIQVANITANQQGIPELADARVILDRNHEFYNQLKVHTSKKQTARHLGRTWLFHALIENGEMLHLQAQPTENQKEHALKNIKPHQFKDIIKYKKQKTFNEIRHLDNNLIYNQSCLMEFGDQDLTILNIFYYQGLWPNTNLIEYFDSQI
jgi:hypothetical protein